MRNRAFRNNVNSRSFRAGFANDLRALGVDPRTGGSVNRAGRRAAAAAAARSSGS